MGTKANSATIILTGTRSFFNIAHLPNSKTRKRHKATTSKLEKSSGRGPCRLPEVSQLIIVYLT